MTPRRNLSRFSFAAGTRRGVFARSMKETDRLDPVYGSMGIDEDAAREIYERDVIWAKGGGDPGRYVWLKVAGLTLPSGYHSCGGATNQIPPDSIPFFFLAGTEVVDTLQLGSVYEIALKGD